MEAQAKEQEMQLKDTMNQRDNETKILVATISANSNQESDDGIQEQPFSEEARANLLEKMRQFDQKMKLDREKLELDKYKSREDIKLKEKSLNKKINIK